MCKVVFLTVLAVEGLGGGGGCALTLIFKVRRWLMGKLKALHPMVQESTNYRIYLLYSTDRTARGRRGFQCVSVIGYEVCVLPTDYFCIHAILPILKTS